MRKERKVIGIDRIQLNTGQLDWLPRNPRTWTQFDIDRTAASIEEDPDFLEERPILVVPFGKEYVAFGGNLRREGCAAAKKPTAPCVVYYPETQEDYETIKRRAIKDNGSFGKWDWDELGNNWDDLPLTDWGIDIFVRSSREDIEDEIDKMVIEQGVKARGSKMGFRSFSFVFSQEDALVVQSYIEQNGKEKLTTRIFELCRGAEAK